MNDAKCHTKDSLTKGFAALAYLTQNARWPWLLHTHSYQQIIECFGSTRLFG